MTEEEARAQAATIAPAAMPLLDRYAALLIAENARQNLIARATEAVMWSRHLLDSLQLASFAREDDQSWIDVGSGAGLPGIVLAIVGRWRVTLVEPRRKRAEFLERVVAELELDASVMMADVRTVNRSYDLLSARAVASVDDLLTMTRGCADERTRFVLPKGRSAQADVDLAQRRWHGLFHVEQSLTDADAGIVIADRVTLR